MFPPLATTVPSLPMPLLPITSPETISLCSSLPLRPDDIFICSYPKSGTTWTQHIIISLLLAHKLSSSSSHVGQQQQCRYDHVSDYAPFYEIDPHWDAPSKKLIPSIRERHEEIGRRVFNTHLRWDMLPKGREVSDAGSERQQQSTAKFVYLIRSPMDVCVSFFHHLSNQVEGGYEGNFDSFFEDWVQGNICFGSWMDHVVSFLSAFVDPGPERDVLLLSYEDMLADTSGAVRDLVSFLDLNVTEDQLRDLLPTFSFDSMKADRDRFQPKSVSWKNGFQFLRKGVRNDSEGVVSDSQRALFLNMMEQACLEDEVRHVLGDKDVEMEKFLCVLRSL